MRLMLALSVAVMLSACGPSEETDRAAAQAVLHALYDKPGAKLDSGPAAIEGDIAVVDWTQGEMGGRALMQRSGEGWRLVLCSGDPLRTREGLEGVGVPPPAAEALAREIQAAEADIAPERLARMASFKGVMRMAPAAHAGGHHGERRL